MKKIIAIFLMLACVFSMASCNLFNKDKGNGDGGKDNTDALAVYVNMYASSVPTKSVTTITEAYEKNTLVSVHSLTTGQVDGKKATRLESNVQTLNDISLDDANKLNLNPINEQKSSQWYWEGKGVSYNKGRTWDASGVDFAPVAGSIAINLDASNFESINYNKEGGVETLVLEVEADKMNSVFGNFMYEGQTFGYDSKVTIVAAGGRISSILIEYTIESYEIGEMETEVEIKQIDMSIKVEYSYDLQEITFDN